MKEIINISTNSPNTNFSKIIEFAGRKFRITHYGVDLNIKLYCDLVAQHDGRADVIAISGLPSGTSIGRKNYLHPIISQISKLVKHSMVVDGGKFREIYLPWTIQKYIIANPDLMINKKVGFLSGIIQTKLLNIFEEYANEIISCDPYFLTGVPLALSGRKNIERFFYTIKRFLLKSNLTRHKEKDFTRAKLLKHKSLARFYNCDIYVANCAQLERVKIDKLLGKTMVLDRLDSQNKKRLGQAGITRIISCTPAPFCHEDINYAVIEAIFQLIKGTKLPITNEDIFEWIDTYNLKPNIIDFKDRLEEVKKFGFIVHPLSTRDLFRHPLLKPILPLSKKINPLIEKMITLAPGVIYGEIGEIVSPNGSKAKGIIYTLFETPKMLLTSEPEPIYKKLIAICKHAKKNGIQVMGLGAYTKIVGDAGVTVARFSPVPVTTGNSLSAAATLWAGSFAIERMGLVKKIDKTYYGQVMIIGATGSIGTVCAKLLCQSWTKVVLISPRPHALLELKEEIEKITPHSEIIISTDSNKYAPTSDYIITTTSANKARIIDIEKVKPGCVICDVSRPFDIGKEDAAKRPDVLVIASGEVKLPGNPQITCDIGLPGNTVYACLAETALLALESRFESFTLSRNLDYHKVREIDALARKHGIKLSTIMGHDLEITPEEIDLCREHALKKINQKTTTRST